LLFDSGKGGRKKYAGPFFRGAQVKFQGGS
jgi:hypothetical protein